MGILANLNQIRDDNLRLKATKLPTLFESALAPNTITKYKAAWSKWIEWSSQYEEVVHCPADAFFICIYFNDLVL